MGLQLIFVVETNIQCKSDWIYIKETIEHFYQHDNTQLKFSVVYMNGKGRYKTKEKEIQKLCSQYASTSRSNRSQVIYCFDCDDYNSKVEDRRFLDEAQKYCKERDAEFVWFCKDIEYVYLEKSIEDNRKKAESVRFKSKEMIKKMTETRLMATEFRLRMSNIIMVLDKYLTRK